MVRPLPRPLRAPLPASPYGMISPGNIDPHKRPVVRNADGSISTVRTMSSGFGEGEVLMPTVSPDGRILSNDDAIQLFRQTGQSFGTFRTPEAATHLAERLHKSQAEEYGDKPAKKPVILNIGGTRVRVDDVFLQMTPEEQQATVDEIAGQLGDSQLKRLEEGIRRAHAAGRMEDVRKLGAAYRAMQASLAPDMSSASAMSQSLQGKVADLPSRQPLPVDFGTATAATLNGIVEGVPVIGPMARDLTDRAQAGIGALMGNDYQQGLADIQRRRAAINQAAPIANIAGALAGGVGAFGSAAKAPAIADALGLTGNLAARVGKSALSGAGISAADRSVRGGDAVDTIAAAGYGGLAGGAIPAVGAAVRGAINAGGRVLGPTVNAMLHPQEEALRRSGAAYVRDAAAGNAGWGASDEVAARSAQIPVLNADRGGETVRALTRSVANQSPEARQTIAAVADDRFAGQGQRAADVIRGIAGGRVDDIGYQEAIKRTAQMVNRPAYEAAFNAPGAHAVWNRDIAELMQSDTFRAAINAAEKRGTDRAAVDGFKAVRNPFEFLPDGNVTLKTNPDGSRALPSLQFWDQVKRNIDGMLGTAQRQGDNTLVADLTAIKRKLVSSLDTVVPQYAKARAGAALFFDAEDALEAGRKFGANMRVVPEAKAAFGKFSDADKGAFRTGYASTLIDRIMAAGDRTNVINQMFKSPASREMIQLVFGAGKARELEAYVRVEELADRLRGAMGNSTTARQLMEMGLGGGAGYILSGGDLMGAGIGAAATKGARMVGQRVDNRVMQSVAKLLTSNDPAMIKKAVYQATMSDQWMDALEQWARLLAAPARGAAVAVNQ